MPVPINRNKIIWSLIIGVLFLAITIPGPRKFLFEGHVFRAIDETATAYVDSSLKRATVAFALARSFNAIVSVFRESQLQLEPGGIGVSFALGAALDPANDLVERFSWVMLVSMTSLGIQKILIEVVPFLSIQIILAISLLCLLGGLWIPAKISHNLLRTGKVLLFASLVLRFAVPTMAVMNDRVYVTFLEEKQTESMAAMGQTVEELKDKQLLTSEVSLTPQTKGDGTEEKPGWFQNFKDTTNNIADQGRQIWDIKSKLAAIKLAASSLIEHIIDLIVIFVVSTIVLPITFLWGILKLGRLFIDRGFGTAAENWFIEKVVNKGP